MKASELQPALPLAMAADVVGPTGLPLGTTLRDVVGDTARFTDYLESAGTRPRGSAQDGMRALRAAFGDDAPDGLLAVPDALPSRPQVPSLAHVDVDVPDDPADAAAARHASDAKAATGSDDGATPPQAVQWTPRPSATPAAAAPIAAGTLRATAVQNRAAEEPAPETSVGPQVPAASGRAPAPAFRAAYDTAPAAQALAPAPTNDAQGWKPELTSAAPLKQGSAEPQAVTVAPQAVPVAPLQDAVPAAADGAARVPAEQPPEFVRPSVDGVTSPSPQQPLPLPSAGDATSTRPADAASAQANAASPVPGDLPQQPATQALPSSPATQPVLPAGHELEGAIEAGPPATATATAGAERSDAMDSEGVKGTQGTKVSEDSEAADTPRTEAAPTEGKPEGKAEGDTLPPTVPRAQIGPVLTPAQFQARALKRKALGLDGGLTGHPAQKAEDAAALRPTGAAGKDAAPDAAISSSGLMPPQPLQWTPPKAAAPSKDASIAMPVSPPTPSAGAYAAPAVPVPAAGVQGNWPADARPAADAPAALASGGAAPAPSEWQANLDAPAPSSPDLAPADAAVEPGVTPAAVMPGAPPTPMQLQLQQDVALEIGARKISQELHIDLVNTPESLPLEVLKAI